MKISNRKIDLITENVMRRLAINENNESLSKLIQDINTPNGWSLDAEYLIILEYLKDNGYNEDVSDYLSEDSDDISNLFHEGKFKKDNNIKSIRVDGYDKEFYIVDLLNNIPSTLHKSLYNELCYPNKDYFDNQELSSSVVEAIDSHFNDILETFIDNGLENGQIANFLSSTLNLTYIDETEDMKLVFVSK